MLTVLGGLAEFERHLILARTNESRQRAQQRAVRFGRKQININYLLPKLRLWVTDNVALQLESASS
jgi:DNA invertase Pin-like site-specific DNA recombinase